MQSLSLSLSLPLSMSMSMSCLAVHAGCIALHLWTPALLPGHTPTKLPRGAPAEELSVEQRARALGAAQRLPQSIAGVKTPGCTGGVFSGRARAIPDGHPLPPPMLELHRLVQTDQVPPPAMLSAQLLFRCFALAISCTF